jgi:hypothetical protein
MGERVKRVSVGSDSDEVLSPAELDSQTTVWLVFGRSLPRTFACSSPGVVGSLVSHEGIRLVLCVQL